MSLFSSLCFKESNKVMNMDDIRFCSDLLLVVLTVVHGQDMLIMTMMMMMMMMMAICKAQHCLHA